MHVGYETQRDATQRSPHCSRGSRNVGTGPRRASGLAICSAHGVARVLLCLVGWLVPAGPAFALGRDVLIYAPPSPYTYTYNRLASTLSEAGATNIDHTPSWTEGVDLSARYRLLVALMASGSGPEQGFAEDLARFINDGGGVVLIEEHDSRTERVNQLLDGLNIAARFSSNSTRGGCSEAPASSSHPVTTNAPVVSFAWSKVTSGGTPLYGMPPVVAVDGTVVVAGDSDLFADTVALGGCEVGADTLQFYRNLYTSLPNDSAGGPGPSGDAGTDGTLDAGTEETPDAGGNGGNDVSAGDTASSGELGMACTLHEECDDGICASLNGEFFCTRHCNVGTCPTDFECDELASVCRPRQSSADDSGCNAPGGSSATWLLLLLTWTWCHRVRSK